MYPGKKKEKKKKKDKCNPTAYCFTFDIAMVKHPDVPSVIQIFVFLLQQSVALVPCF